MLRTCSQSAVMLLDISAQESALMCCLCLFVSIQYYAESHGIIYVIDSTDEERLSESKEAFGEQHTLTLCPVYI